MKLYSGPMFSLRKINRVLRWTGWRLAVTVDDEIKAKEADGREQEPTLIGFTWYGWDFDTKVDLVE